MITQKYEETLTLPEGGAFTIEPNQTIRLELHYVNASDTEKVAEATSTFIPIDEASFQHEADFLFIGNPDIDLGPGINTLGPTYFPLPADLAGSSFFAITGHEHKWGTDVYVATIHTPPFQVPDNGGFRFTCTWDNQSGSNVGFGEGANDELCFFWAYYYPSKGAKVCVHTSQLGGQDICCPDNPACNLLF